MGAQPKNYILSVLIVVFLVVLILTGLKYTEDATGNTNLKPVNIISQVERETPTENNNLIAKSQDALNISLVQEEEKLPPPRAHAPQNAEEQPVTISSDSLIYNNELGIVRFCDYSANKNGLHSFFSNLQKVNTLNRPVRIAFFGDSFIEGDILSGDLRRLFQENFGGKGVGMMPITSIVSGFRRTVIHQFSAWNTCSFNNSNKSKLGINGCVYTPNNNAWVYYQGVNKNLLNTFQKVSVFYSLPDNDTRIFYKKDKGTSVYAKLPKNKNIGRVDIHGSCNNIQISFPPVNNLCVYGVSLEDTTGVMVDNYSIRGFSGTGLQYLPQERLSQFCDLLQYDLIILGYGLNVTEAKRTNYQGYENEMIKMVNHLKSSFPNTSVLLVGVPDRSQKINGSYETMPGILAMVEHQKNICQKTGIVFWNLFEAMGGKNSMPLFVNSKPPKANKDYTHLTFAGGEYLGNLFYETFMYEKAIYERQFLQAMLK